jgi:hypothetical protein
VFHLPASCRKFDALYIGSIAETTYPNTPIAYPGVEAGSGNKPGESAAVGVEITTIPPAQVKVKPAQTTV